MDGWGPLLLVELKSLITMTKLQDVEVKREQCFETLLHHCQKCHQQQEALAANVDSYFSS